MAESAHRTAAPPEPTIYPVPDPDLAAPILDIALTGAILTLNDELAAASREYAAAAPALATAVVEEAEARQVLAWHEAIARDHAHATGLPGTNEAARKAYLDRHLLTDNVLAGMRSRLEEAQRARTLAESRCRVCGAAREDLRAQLYALAAVARCGGR